MFEHYRPALYFFLSTTKTIYGPKSYVYTTNTYRYAHATTLHTIKNIV